MTTKELKDLALKQGLEAVMLDEYVHDACSAMAAAINNSGMYRQIEFLVKRWGKEEVEGLLRHWHEIPKDEVV